MFIVVIRCHWRLSGVFRYLPVSSDVSGVLKCPKILCYQMSLEVLRCLQISSGIIRCARRPKTLCVIRCHWRFSGVFRYLQVSSDVVRCP